MRLINSPNIIDRRQPELTTKELKSITKMIVGFYSNHDRFILKRLLYCCHPTVGFCFVADTRLNPQSQQNTMGSNFYRLWRGCEGKFAEDFNVSPDFFTKCTNIEQVV